MKLLETLNDLISIPSVNPMGRRLEGLEYLETRLTEYLQQAFDSLGLPTLRQTVAPGRDNILARLDGDSRGRPDDCLMLWDVHQDTVPVDGMTIEPFSPRHENGRIYGRGSCDVKGGMAAMLSALSELVSRRPPNRPTVVLACTVNEEHGFSGATQLAQLWSTAAVSEFLGRRPDACIVAEPTELQVVVSHKGVVRWKCSTQGRAAHSSQPELGENAIYQMGRVMEALDTYARETVPSLMHHSSCGRPSLSVGTISGGISVNTVPERCTIEIDRRLVPGEQPQSAYRHVIDALSSLDNVNLTHEPPYMESSGLADDANGPLAATVRRAVEKKGLDCECIGVAYGTNASAIATSGVPTIVFGPGSIAQAHTADEWIDIQQLETASEVLFDVAANGLADTE